jgi:quercetin dioxygenase-like cupin family protein
MYDQELVASQVQAVQFPFAHDGDITVAIRNTNYAQGPVMIDLVMKPGSVIPAHVHEGMAEGLYVLEGDFVNEGKHHLPGTSLHVKAGEQHGPHTTERGCKVLLLWTAGAASQDANLGDFKVPQAAGATR